MRTYNITIEYLDPGELESISNIVGNDIYDCNLDVWIDDYCLNTFPELKKHLNVENTELLSQGTIDFVVCKLDY